eukprot:1025310-Amphidinium_carterae.3
MNRATALCTAAGLMRAPHGNTMLRCRAPDGTRDKWTRWQAYCMMTVAERRKWSKLALPVIDFHCSGGSMPVNLASLSPLPIQRCIHRVGKLHVQRWLAKCLERWNQHLRHLWPKQGVDVVVDRCLSRLHRASSVAQPAAPAAMLRVLGNGFTLPARMGQRKSCLLCSSQRAGVTSGVWRHLPHYLEMHLVA